MRRAARAARTGAAGLAALLLATACGAAREPLPGPEGGGVSVPPHEALAFQQRTEGFYERLILRRFNTLETFNDPVLREHFRSLDLFFDYYADLAQALSDGHFEKSRPLEVEVEEFLFESAERAWVQVRFVGQDGRPLRPGRIDLVRRDRWERVDGAWWMTPGKL